MLSYISLFYVETTESDVVVRADELLRCKNVLLQFTDVETVVGMEVTKCTNPSRAVLLISLSNEDGLETDGFTFLAERNADFTASNAAHFPEHSLINS